MNSLRNRVQLFGNPGMDPEVKSLENGNKLARFSMATNDHYKNAKGEKVTDTQWHNVIAWGKTAELVEKFVRKGKELGVEGKLVNRQYESKDGEKKYITEVVINDLLFVGSKE